MLWQVVAVLTALVAGGAKVSGAGISGGALDHLSIQVGDLERSTKFYSEALGLTVATGSRPDGSVRLNLPKGGYLTIRKFNPPGKIDHFGIKLEGFNKEDVTRQQKSQGIVPVDEPNLSRTPDNPNGGAGFHVVDPDGVNVQLL